MSEVPSNQVALVTGGSRGIGQAVALNLAQKGYKVTATATTLQGAQAITEALSIYGGAGVCLDVNDGPAAQALVDTLAQNHGGLHVLVNNAGITRDNLSMRMKDEDWSAVIDTNLTAVFRLIRAATRHMMKQRFGRIINITSIIGATGNVGQANYAAAKAAVAGMTRSLARELGGRQITVNCVAPGFIATQMTSVLSTEQKTHLLQNVPLGRLGSCEDVAHAVAFLASAHAGYITGTQLHVNGGMYMN